jgi:hypothetical protein
MPGGHQRPKPPQAVGWMIVAFCAFAFSTLEAPCVCALADNDRVETGFFGAESQLGTLEGWNYFQPVSLSQGLISTWRWCDDR